MTKKPTPDVLLMFAGLGMILVLYQVLWQLLVAQ